MSRDFEIVESRRNLSAEDLSCAIRPASPQNNRIADAVADHFGQILEVASSIVEIEKMRVQSDAVLKQMEASRKNLLAEAEAYAKKKNADTNSVVQKMQIVREMIRDFYQCNTNTNLSGEDFSRIISSIVCEMGRL